MTVSKGLGTYGDGAGVVTPTDHKVAHLGLVSKTGAGSNTVRPGLFFDGVTTIVTGAANMSYDVAPFTAVSSRGGSAGAVFFANDGVVNVATTAAPGTDSRIDVVYVWQREFSLDGGTTGPVVGVVQGAVAASPVAPSLAAFPGAVELARVTVPAGVTATNSGATITQAAPFTALDGAPIPVRTASSLPSSGVSGARARAIDTGLVYEWSGSAWFIANAYCKVSNVTSAPHDTVVNLGAAGNLYGEDSDRSDWHSTSTNTDRITPNIPGRYKIEVIGAWASNTTGLRYYWIGRNGSFDNKNRKVNSSTDLAADPNGACYVAADFVMNGTTDYFHVTSYQTSGAALAMNAQVVVTYLGVA